MELISSVPGTCSPGVSDLHNSSCIKGLPEKPEWKKNNWKDWNVIDPFETYTNKWAMKSVMTCRIR